MIGKKPEVRASEVGGTAKALLKVVQVLEIAREG
jgi:hypothetical protein